MSILKRKAWMPALVAALALIGGSVAWASQSQTISLGSGSSIAVTAMLLPGSGGGSVSAKHGRWVEEVDLRWVEEVDLDIDFDPDGTLYFFGEDVGSYDTDATHTVEADFRNTSNGWTVDVTITDNVTGNEAYSVTGHELGSDGPQECTTTADYVFSLMSS